MSRQVALAATNSANLSAFTRRHAGRLPAGQSRDFPIRLPVWV